jgi:hypothetical protein
MPTPYGKIGRRLDLTRCSVAKQNTPVAAHRGSVGVANRLIVQNLVGAKEPAEAPLVNKSQGVGMSRAGELTADLRVAGSADLIANECLSLGR